MSVIANLKVMLGADSSELTSTFKKTDKQSKKWAAAQKRRNKAAAESFKKIAQSAALVGSAVAAASLQAIKYADQLSKSSRTLGITVEQLQEYTFAAERSGVSTDEMVKGLQMFNKFTGQAARGVGTAKVAFEDMGIALRDINGNLRPSNDLIDEFVEKMSKIESPAMRAGLASDVFGRAGVKLLPMMEQGKEGLDKLKIAAHAMGNVMSNETGASAEVLKDKMDTFTTALETKFYSALVDGTNEYLPAIVRALDVVEGSFTTLYGVIKVGASILHGVDLAFISLGLGIVRVGHDIINGITHSFSLVPLFFDQLKADVKLGIHKVIDAAIQAGDKAMDSAPYFIKNLFGYTDGGTASGSSALVKSLEADLAAANAAIEKAGVDYRNSEREPSALEIALMGYKDEAIENVKSSMNEGISAISEGIAIAGGTKLGLAGNVDAGVDALGGAGAVGGDDGENDELIKRNKLLADQSKWEDTVKASRMSNLQSGINLLGQFAKEGSVAAKMTIVLQTAMNIASIAMSTEAAKMRALAELGPINGLPMAASIQAMGAVSMGIAGAAGAVSLAGQFHDGIDNVPSTGTYLLEKGERVVDSRLNGDLKDALSNGGGMGQSGTQNITFSVQGVEDPDVINKVIQQNRGDFESMLRQINSDRAGGGLI